MDVNVKVDAKHVHLHIHVTDVNGNQPIKANRGDPHGPGEFLSNETLGKGDSGDDELMG